MLQARNAFLALQQHFGQLDSSSKRFAAVKPLTCIFLLIYLSANSSHLFAPREAIENYLQYSNDKDTEALDSASGQTSTLINGGQITN